MARFKAVRTGSTVLLLLLLILALGFGGLVWFDYLGFVDARQLVSPVLRLVGINQPKPMENAEALDLLDQERFKMQQAEMLLWQEELAQREEGIRIKEAEIQQIMEALEEKENALLEQENSFNDRLKRYDNRKANLRQASRYFVGMPPDQSVERLLAMEDQDVIDLLRTTEEIAQEEGAASMVSYWLSLMPAERAAELSRKMLKKPEE
jgi:flagellar protein FlbB